MVPQLLGSHLCKCRWPSPNQPSKYHLVVAEVAHDDAHDCDEEVDEDEGHDHVEQVEQPDRQVPAHTLTAVEQLCNNLLSFFCYVS